MKGPTCADLLRVAELHARKVLIGGTNEMIPITHLVRADGFDFVLGTPWRDDIEKEMTRQTLSALMRDGDVIRYLVMCEAWMREATPSEAANWKPGDPPPRVDPIRDHPERKEIVIACAVERAGKMIRVWETKRDKHGLCVDLVEQSPADKYDSPFLNLLPIDA